MKGFVLNRKQYQNIRRMDHCQLSMWAESVYKSGYQDGKKDAEGLTMDEIREVLVGVKGIGEAKAALIINAIEEKMGIAETEKA